MKFMKKNNKNKGFTLIEIIVVLVIMVIMAAIAVPAVTSYISDARKSQYVQEVDSMYSIVQIEEAKAKANSKSPDYTTIAKTVMDQLGDSKITNLEISKSNGVYTFKYTSNSDQNVTVTFTENSDDMEVTLSAVGS